MAIEHRDIPDAQRHEPKGASTAPNGSVWVANGLGSGAFFPVSSIVPPPVTYPAANVTLVDAGGVVTSSNVEGAIQEIGTTVARLNPRGPFSGAAEALSAGVTAGNIYYNDNGDLFIQRLIGS